MADNTKKAKIDDAAYILDSILRAVLMKKIDVLDLFMASTATEKDREYVEKEVVDALMFTINSLVDSAVNTSTLILTQEDLESFCNRLNIHYRMGGENDG